MMQPAAAARSLAIAAPALHVASLLGLLLVVGLLALGLLGLLPLIRDGCGPPF